ncbi:MAG: hypothetical protein GXY41_06310 [Phycisphaerae bacterium]|nr:hypothetical protein [Phycisphaerae bacterium]
MFNNKHKKYISIAIFVLLFVGMIYAVKVYLNRLDCSLRLQSLCSLMLVYHNEYNELPNHERWYDLLICEFALQDDFFKCPSCQKKGKIGTYFINKHLNSKWDGPGDLVFLFEGEFGWNQYGDANDILPLHSGGSHVLFLNGNVEFIKQEDFDKLIWTSSSNKTVDNETTGINIKGQSQ